MSFAENLKQLRKERNLSQEALAELLDVSRQAVSKWEQGEGYPEVEKLLFLSKTLNISLDALMSTGIIAASNTPQPTGRIIITSPHENVIATCVGIQASQPMKGGDRAPKYALFGTDDTVSSFGSRNIFLGWYANIDQVHKEISGIQTAIAAGIPEYTLQYSVKTQKRWGFIHIVES